MNRHFSFKLKDEVIRGMNRQQYYSAKHLVRWWAWKVDKMINWDKFQKHITNVMLYGHGFIDGRDFIK